MKRIATLIAAIPLLSMSAEAADGVWTFNERTCLTVDGDKGCSRGHEDFMFLGSTAYYRPDAGGYWTEIGAVTIEGKSVFVQVSREGVGRLVAARAGVDVTELLQEFSFTYKGRLRGNRIVNGRARVNLVITVDETTHRIKGNATFTGRRIGESYPVPPPDPYYYGYGEITAAASSHGNPDAAFSAVRGAVSHAVGW
jgi:hypothetical protein